MKNLERMPENLEQWRTGFKTKKKKEKKKKKHSIAKSKKNLTGVHNTKESSLFTQN